MSSWHTDSNGDTDSLQTKASSRPRTEFDVDPSSSCADHRSLATAIVLRERVAFAPASVSSGSKLVAPWPPKWERLPRGHLRSIGAKGVALIAWAEVQELPFVPWHADGHLEWACEHGKWEPHQDSVAVPLIHPGSADPHTRRTSQDPKRVAPHSPSADAVGADGHPPDSTDPGKRRLPDRRRSGEGCGASIAPPADFHSGSGCSSCPGGHVHSPPANWASWRCGRGRVDGRPRARSCGRNS